MNMLRILSVLLVSAGLALAVDYLQNLRFEDEDIAYLASLKPADSN